MPNLNSLTEKDISPLFNKSQWNKGRDYVSRIRLPARMGNHLQAQVVDNNIYLVEVEVEPNGIHTTCNCPYGYGCKHVAAVLLKWIISPTAFAVETAVSTPTPHALETIPQSPEKAQRPKELPEWLLKPFAVRQKEAQQKFSASMDQYRLPDLREIASRHQWKIKGTIKSAVIEQIKENLLDPSQLAAIISRLTPEQQAVFYAVALLGTYLNHQTEAIENVANLWSKVDKTFNVILSLKETGLIQSEIYSSTPISLSPFLLALLHRVLTNLVPTTVVLPPHDRQLTANPYRPIRTALQLTLLWEGDSITLRNPLPRPQLEKYYPALQEWDYDPAELIDVKQKGQLTSKEPLMLQVPPPRSALPEEIIERFAAMAGGRGELNFFYHLLVKAGIFQPGSPVTVWPEVKNEFFLRSEAAQWSILVRAFLQMNTWSELWEVIRQTPGLKLVRSWQNGYFKPFNLQETLLQMRHTVLRVLACLPDEQWIPYEALQKIMRQVWQTGENYPTLPKYYTHLITWQIMYQRRLVDGTSPTDWDILQGQFIQYLLEKPLHWLGLADVCLKNQQVVAFRLHGLADVYWDQVERELLPVETADSTNNLPRLSTSAERILVNPVALNAQTHTFLYKIARLQGTSAHQFVYQLDVETVHATFEAGNTLSHLVEEWQTCTGVPMPASIQAALTIWWKGYGQLRIYQDVTLIELGDEYALAELKAVTSLDKLLIAEISPRLILIPETAVATLTAELEKAGYTPKKEDS